MRKNIINTAFIILLVILCGGCNREDVNQRELINNYVKEHEATLNEVINEIKSLEEIDEKDIIKKLPDDIKISYIYKANTRNYVDFSVDEGLTSSSHYYGFYYSTLNEPITVMAIFGEKEVFENGYKIQEQGNEDWYYTEKIVDNFFYYEAHY